MILKPKRFRLAKNDERWFSFQLRLCCIVQIVVIVIYTLLLTVIDASMWLHPFGPLTKNLPIIILIMYVFDTLKHPAAKR
jgi:hypothetical protein